MAKQNPQKEYQGRISAIDGTGRLEIIFDTPILVKHDLGDMKVRKISLRYDAVKERHPDWAKQHPYRQALIKSLIPVNYHTLQAVVTKYHKKQLTGVLDALRNGNSEDAHILKQRQ